MGISGEWNPGLSRRRCESKCTYASERVASKVAHRRSVEIGEWLRAYKCPDCSVWHIGHANETDRLAHNLEPGELPWKIACVRCGGRISKERQMEFDRFCTDRCQLLDRAEREAVRKAKAEARAATV